MNLPAFACHAAVRDDGDAFSSATWPVGKGSTVGGAMGRVAAVTGGAERPGRLVGRARAMTKQVTPGQRHRDRDGEPGSLANGDQPRRRARRW